MNPVPIKSVLMESERRFLPRWRVGILIALQLWGVASLQAATRVALLDFSTDDNSYRSIEAAAQFTGLVQIGLADERDVEWVERSQLRLAKSEFALAEMRAAGGASPLRRGRMLGANWSVTGHFSSDDRERPTVAFQVIELNHADVLARDTVVLPEVASGAARLGTNQVASAVAALRRLLADARAKQLQAVNQARLAFLFFADASEFGFGRGPQTFGRELVQTLERVATTNQQLRLVRFPKAYQSTEESELAVDGIIASGEDSWRQTADRYVWGNYRTTNSYTAGRRETKLEVELNLWDGVGRPLVVKETLPADARGEISANQQSDLINRLVGRITTAVRRARAEPDSPALRQEVAGSIIQSYLRMMGRGASNLGLHDQEKSVEAVHMLETACFFDPNNAEARVLWLTCRYGWWMDFRDRVKHEFWAKFWRSQAWGDYVERFGLRPVKVQLPFPYSQWGLPSAYLRSAEEAIEMWPEHFEYGENEPHGPMQEAQFHGFPKEISTAVAARWKLELQAEYWKRLTKVVEFIMGGDWSPPDKLPPTILSDVVRGLLGGSEAPSARLALLEQIWPECAKCAQKFGKQWIVGAGELAAEMEGDIADLCRQAGKPEKADQLRAMLLPRGTTVETPVGSGNPASAAQQQTNEALVAKPPIANDGRGNLSTRPNLASAIVQTPPPQSELPESRMVDTPDWLKTWFSLRGMFQLYPPNILPLEVKPEIQAIQFPARSEVQVIRQMEFRGDQLWILAMDERSAHSSSAKPDLGAERRDEVTRLWCLAADNAQPSLFKADNLPSGINTMLFQQDRLWLGGDSVMTLSFPDHTIKRFGLAEGLTTHGIQALAVAGDRVFAAGDAFKVSVFDRASSRWEDLKLPYGYYSGGTGNPFLLTGNNRWLGYVAGETRFYDVLAGSWTNLPQVNSVRCFASDGEMFWIGGEKGLQRFDTARQIVQNWTAPSFIESPMIGLGGSAFVVNPQISGKGLADAEAQILNCLKYLADVRKRAHVANKNLSNPFDPFHMVARISGGVTALADDGEYLWLGVENYFGRYLLLLHKPSLSLVAGHTMGDRGRISSLALAGKYVWVGTAYGDNALFRLSKEAFLSVARSHWVNLGLTPAERQSVVENMTKSKQALHAFYAGDDKRVLELLGGMNPESVGLEEMLLLAFCNDASGVDDLAQCRAWFDRISARYPDTPWARYAGKTLRANETAHEAKRARDILALVKFDLNHDGKLDEAETWARNQDPDFAAPLTPKEKELRPKMSQLIARYDKNKDSKLNRVELHLLSGDLTRMRPANQPAVEELLVIRPPLIRPYDTRFDPQMLLQRYDPNHDGSLDAAELLLAAMEIWCTDDP